MKKQETQIEQLTRLNKLLKNKKTKESIQKAWNLSQEQLTPKGKLRKSGIKSVYDIFVELVRDFPILRVDFEKSTGYNTYIIKLASNWDRVGRINGGTFLTISPSWGTLDWDEIEKSISDKIKTISLIIQENNERDTRDEKHMDRLNTYAKKQGYDKYLNIRSSSLSSKFSSIVVMTSSSSYLNEEDVKSAALDVKESVLETIESMEKELKDLKATL